MCLFGISEIDGEGEEGDDDGLEYDEEVDDEESEADDEENGDVSLSAVCFHSLVEEAREFIICVSLLRRSMTTTWTKKIQMSM